jgi:hypothetical protein
MSDLLLYNPPKETSHDRAHYFRSQIGWRAWKCIFTSTATGLSKDSVANISQVRTVDKSFLTDKIIAFGGCYSNW